MSKDDFFVVEGLGGEKSLEGSISVVGAKNEVLKAMAASLLFEDEVVLENVPEIEDVSRMSELLSVLGVSVEKRDTRALSLQTKSISESDLKDDIAKRMRASIVLTGPLLAREGKVSFPHPGGCVIGARPIDIFLRGFEKMGARVEVDNTHYRLFAENGLSGADIFFNVVSVTATETLMLTAVLAKGTTTLQNAAMEPEVSALAEFLNASGAQISGAGTPTITIQGGDMLRAGGKPHKIIPDRIETGSFLILGALCAKNLRIEGCEPLHVGMVVELLRNSGVPIEIGTNSLSIKDNTSQNDTFRAFDIHTHEYPGLATDMQSPMVVFLTQASGESRVFETIFENRLNWVEDLVRMGAHITLLNPQQALIKGPTPLRGRDMESPDIRAGLAFLLAAIVARGRSYVRNSYFIDRGHERIEERLGALGVPIERHAR